jgi:hypothetical protein
VLKSSGFAIDVSKRKPISRLTFVRLSVVAIRDLQEIEAHWGTKLALERLAECRAMLRTVLATS